MPLVGMCGRYGVSCSERLSSLCCFVFVREKVMGAAKGEGDGLEFDKDDQIAMNFVAAASNLRSRVFQVCMCRVLERAIVYCTSDNARSTHSVQTT